MMRRAWKQDQDTNVIIILPTVFPKFMLPIGMTYLQMKNRHAISVSKASCLLG